VRGTAVTANITTSESYPLDLLAISDLLAERGFPSQNLAAAEATLATPTELTEKIAVAIRATIFADGLENYVTERFPDEIEYYRNGDWHSFTERRDVSWQMRTDRAARAVVAAVFRSDVVGDHVGGAGGL
jgi:hypothetical protein